MASRDPGFRRPAFRILRRPLPRSPWVLLAILIAVVAGFVSQVGMPKIFGRRFRDFGLFLFIVAVVAVATAIQRWLGRGRVSPVPGETMDRSAMAELVDRLATAGFYSHARPQ